MISNDKKDEKKGPLDIPINVPPIDYIVTGIGLPEIAKIGLCILMGLGVGIYFFVATGNIYLCFILPVITGTLGFITFRRDDHTENLIDKFGFMFEFKRSQKVYEYEYYNIYEDVEPDVEGVKDEFR